jgi:hypothetical protein
MLCRDRDLQAIMAEKQQVAGTMVAKINNVIYMELYSGAKMMDDKYKKTNVAGSIDLEFTVLYSRTPMNFLLCFAHFLTNVNEI